MRVLKVLVCLFVIVVAVNASAALPVRTWVSGVGDDAWPCSLTAPCKSFAGAYAKTEPGGQISVLDPGGYGALTITHSITIDGGGNFGSVLYTGDGITVNFTANDGLGNNVVIRGLSVTSNYGGGYGVVVLGTVPTNVHVLDTTFVRTAVAVGMFPGASGSTLRLDNIEGSQISGTGVLVSPPAGGAAAKLTMSNVRISQTGSGAFNAGVRIVANTNGTISDSKFSNGSQGVLIESASVHLSLVRTVLSENSNNGLLHYAMGITTLLDGCSIFGNTVGVSNVGGTVYGYSNNAIGFNTPDVIGNPIQSLTPK